MLLGFVFAQVDKTVEMLTTKYMKAFIHYEGIQRIERFFAPKEALREAATNAIVHKDYASANPIQISVYEDKVIIWNAADIPVELPIERLLGRHPSIPHNPLLAAAFFRAGYIESWGRGIEKIKTECKIAETRVPEIQYAFGGVQVTFTGEIPVTSEAHVEMSGESSVKTPVKTPEMILHKLEQNPEMTLAEVALAINKSLSAIERASSRLVKAGRLHYIGPQKGGHWEVAEK
jgi:ATP-dependent DNA helicase RecG